MEEDFISEGLNSFMSFNYTYSLQMFNKADSLNNTNPDIKFYLGMCHMKLGDYVNSIKEFNSSQLYGNNNYEVFYNRGISNLNNGDLISAKQDLIEAINLGNEAQKKLIEIQLQKIS